MWVPSRRFRGKKKKKNTWGTCPSVGCFRFPYSVRVISYAHFIYSAGCLQLDKKVHLIWLCLPLAVLKATGTPALTSGPSVDADAGAVVEVQVMHLKKNKVKKKNKNECIIKACGTSAENWDVCITFMAQDGRSLSGRLTFHSSAVVICDASGGAPRFLYRSH